MASSGNLRNRTSDNVVLPEGSVPDTRTGGSDTGEPIHKLRRASTEVGYASSNSGRNEAEGMDCRADTISGRAAEAVRTHVKSWHAIAYLTTVVGCIAYVWFC